VLARKEAECGLTINASSISNDQSRESRDMTLELAALLFSAFALWASWRANSIAQKALNESGKIKLLEVQAEVMREIDIQHAKLGSLLAAAAEAALLFIQNPELARADLEGLERLKQNIEVVQSLRKRYEEGRQLAENNVGRGSIEAETKILANIRGLTVHVQEDLEKELRYVEGLKEQARAAQQQVPADGPASRARG